MSSVQRERKTALVLGISRERITFCWFWSRTSFGSSSKYRLLLWLLLSRVRKKNQFLGGFAHHIAVGGERRRIGVHSVHPRESVLRSFWFGLRFHFRWWAEARKDEILASSSLSWRKDEMGEFTFVLIAWFLIHLESISFISLRRYAVLSNSSAHTFQIQNEKDHFSSPFHLEPFFECDCVVSFGRYSGHHSSVLSKHDAWFKISVLYVNQLINHFIACCFVNACIYVDTCSSWTRFQWSI